MHEHQDQRSPAAPASRAPGRAAVPASRAGCSSRTRSTREAERTSSRGGAGAASFAGPAGGSTPAGARGSPRPRPPPGSSMKASSRVAAPRWRTSSAGLSLTSTRPACISEMRSQRSASFMKWVEMKIVTLSRRDRSISRLPEDVARDRIDARGRLVEDQQLGLVHHRHRQRQALADAQRQLSGQGVQRPRSARSAATSSSTRAGISASGTWNSRACSTRFWRTVSSP